MIKVIKRTVQITVAISAAAGLVAFMVERFKKSKRGHVPYGFYEKYIKRPLDAFLATGALIVFSPVLAVTALLVKINLGSPVIFSQERPGKDEEVFRLLKFRSMSDERDSNGELLPDEVRLTKFGKALRASSLDELISLVNIIKGDLAVIGPRPLLSRDVPYMNEQQQRRYEVRPGLTGLAQCSGRNMLSWDTKLEYDVEYVEHISFAKDCQIFLKTIEKVFKREGISYEKGTEMDLKDWNALSEQEKEALVGAVVQ